MRYYILTTTKFAQECIRHLIYGANQSNWLVNMNKGDIIFISQFNFTSQNIFGPFRVNDTLFYDKSVIYPNKKYFYRIQIKPLPIVKCLEETDLYLHSIRSKRTNLFSRIISLVQQNKHLPCISLTQNEGRAVLDAIQTFGYSYYSKFPQIKTYGKQHKVNQKYICNKNRLDKKQYFSSESDFESYLILSLKNSDSKIYNNTNTLLNKYKNNNLKSSVVYNQFIFGNAYPADIVVTNRHNINVFELKKDKLTEINIPQIEKEMKKHLYYSLFSNRITQQRNRQFNFFLISLKNNYDHQSFQYVRSKILKEYKELTKTIDDQRKNTITLAEYNFKNHALLLKETNYP